MARNRRRARADRPEKSGGDAVRNGNGAEQGEELPFPLEHATPDAELIEAQLAVGRPSLADAQPFDDEPGAREADDAQAQAGSQLPAAPRESLPARTIAFLQGSWRELQRVQWPDRRQVMQATGVVIGFVIVAAAFLGVADWAAGKIVTFILK